MKFKLIESEKPSSDPKIEEKSRFDRNTNTIYIQLWEICEIAKKINVSKTSVFWHILRHEILHIEHEHEPYLDIIKTQRDVQKYCSYYKKNELEAMPEPKDTEIKKLNKYMLENIKCDMKLFHKNFKERGQVY